MVTIRHYFNLAFNHVFIWYLWLVKFIIVTDDSQKRKNQFKKENGHKEDALNGIITYFTRLTTKLVPKKVSLSDKIDIVENLKSAIRFRNSTREVFRILSERKDLNPFTRSLCGEVYDLMAYKKLFQCLEEIPGILDEEFVTQIKIAESGTAAFEETYARILATLVERRKRRNAVRILMIEPIIIAVMILGIEIFNAVYLVPDMVQGIPSLTLPPTIQSYMDLNDIILNHKLEYGIKLAIAVVVIRFIWKLDATQLFMHWLILQTPYLNKSIEKWEVSKFFGSVADLIQAGASLQQAVSISIRLISNKVIRASLKEDLKLITKRATLGTALKDSVYIDLRVRTQLMIAQQNSDMVDTIVSVADEYNDYVKAIIEAPMKVIVPLMITATVIYLGVRMLPLYNDIQNLIQSFH